jgi:hypothetical protein
MKKSELKEMIKAAMVFEAEDSKKGNKEEQKRMEGAIRDDRDHIKDLEKDIKDNEEKLAKLKKDFKDDVNEGGKYYEDDMKEAEDVEVEDNEDVNVDIDDEVDVDDESTTSDIDVTTTIPGESEDTEAVLGLLTKALDQAQEMGDEKLTDQIGNTITYFTRAHVARVDEMDLDMELDPTDVTKINPEAAAVIGLDEKKDDMDEEMRKDDMDEEMKDEVKENLNESVEAFPLWNRIK